MADLLGYIHPDDRAMTAPPGAPAKEFVNEYRVIRDPANVRVLVNRGTWIPGADGHPGYIVGTSHDVTEERATQAARRRADEQFRRVFDDGLVAMAICDTSLRIVHVNEAFRRMTRLPREQLIGAYAGDFSRSEQPQEELAAAVEALMQGTVFTEERRYVRPEGGLGWIEVVISPVDIDGEVVEYLAQVRDVTERHRQNAELRHMAAHDPLTGVLNRRAFDEALQRYVSSLRPGQRCGTLLMIDLDNFKRHNDTYGHASGDTLLIGITQAVNRSLREHDILGRLGGDEFVVLLPETEVDEAEMIATRLVTEVREYALATTTDDECPVTASIGVVGLRPGHSDGSSFVLDADRALYAAKAQGRDRWVRVGS
jgi:diguanylate cyclase (GGDEF)-like protein/PAS domain S-box-containing protein